MDEYDVDEDEADLPMNHNFFRYLLGSNGTVNKYFLVLQI